MTQTQEKIQLDIACGQSKYVSTEDGTKFTGVDLSPDSDADVVHDLTKYPWPFEDNSVEKAYCSHYVEHIPPVVERGGVEVDGLFAFMDELHRVLAPDAQVRIIHPYLKSDRAFQDPTHRRFIPDATWYYFARAWREEQKLDHYPVGCDFGVVNIVANFNAPWNMKSAEAQQFAIQHYWNVIADLVVDLKALKDDE